MNNTHRTVKNVHIQISMCCVGARHRIRKITAPYMGETFYTIARDTIQVIPTVLRFDNKLSINKNYSNELYI